MKRPTVEPRVANDDFLFLSASAAAADYEYCWFAWIGVLDRPSDRIVPVAAAGYEDHYLEDVRVEISDTLHGQGPEGSAARRNRPWVVSDIESDPRAAPWRDAALGRGYRSAAAFPVRCGDAIVAVLGVYSVVTDGFGAIQLEELSKLAAELGHALRQDIESEDLPDGMSFR